MFDIHTLHINHTYLDKHSSHYFSLGRYKSFIERKEYQLFNISIVFITYHITVSHK